MLSNQPSTFAWVTLSQEKLMDNMADLNDEISDINEARAVLSSPP